MILYSSPSQLLSSEMSPANHFPLGYVHICTHSLSSQINFAQAVSDKFCLFADANPNRVRVSSLTAVFRCP